jgi:hypothetical protein
LQKFSEARMFAMLERVSKSGAFEGAKLKLARARHHLTTLKEEHDAFCARTPFRVSMEREGKAHAVTITEDSGEQRVEKRKQEFAVFRFHINENPPLVWSIVIGDCVQNARSALEHLAWQLAYPEFGGCGPKPGRTAFPICLKHGEFKKIKDEFGRPVQEAMEKVQPYELGENAGQHPLWILHDLARIDRHRVLHVVAAALVDESVASYIPETPRSGGVQVTPANIDDELYESITRSPGSFVRADNDKLAEIFSRNPFPPYAARPVAFSARYFVAFGSSETATGWPVIETLNRILGYVEDEVLIRIESLF